MFSRRVRPDAPVAVYLSRVQPTRSYRMRVQVGRADLVEGLDRTTAGFSLRVHSPRGSEESEIHLDLVRDDYIDIFIQMLEILIPSVAESADARKAVEELKKQLDQWERFMRSFTPSGLSKEKQKGLVGELLVIRKLLSNGVSPSRLVGAWQGPAGAAKDFLLDGVGLEVKTLSGRDRQVAISSASQLDGHGLRFLFLLCVEVAEEVADSTSLADLVDHIRAQLPGAVAEDFAARLIVGGYLQSQRHLYLYPTFALRNIEAFIVRPGFPAIEASTLPSQLSNVTYDLDVAGLTDYMVSERDWTAAFAGDSP
jgi:hypothetical protein